MSSSKKPKKAQRRRAGRIAALRRKGLGPKVSRKIANGKRKKN
jgi:hypothetical protein